MSAVQSVAAILVLWGSVAWFVGLFFQVMDALNSVLDIRLAKDTPLRERGERRRVTENIWAVVGGIALAVAIAFGVDIAVRIAFDWNDLVLAGVVLVGLVLLAMVGGLAIVAGITWREDVSYAILRANLAEDVGVKLKSEHIAEFRAQLAAIDARRRHIRFGLRDRAGLRAVRVRLVDVADAFAIVPPTGFGAVAAVRWKTANAYLWRGNAFRLVPSVLALVVGAAAILDGSVVITIVAFLALILSFLVALLESRLALASKIAWHAVYQKQRREAVDLLEDLERSARKGIAGLGDRVTRALQILRDQQG